MPILGIFDFIGVFVFALSGALVAIQRKMDVFGIYVLATVTACGGGVIRDVVMDNGCLLYTSNAGGFQKVRGPKAVDFLQPALL